MRFPTTLNGVLLVSLLGLSSITGTGAKEAPGATRPPASPPRVVIVCWDGAKPHVLKEMMGRHRLPALKSLVKSGRWTWDARTILPSSTLPSHVSMLTGLPPSQHGVTWNSDRPEKGPLAVPTVFSLAKAAGLKTAMVVGKTKLKLLAGTGNVDSEVLETGPPHEVAMQALDILTQKDPDLLFVHFAAADGEGHDYGWGNSATGQPPSPEYEGALAACDRATAEILKSVHSDGRWRTTLLILTADHGGKEKNHGGEDPQETSIPWVADGGLVVARGELRVPVVTEDTAATALSALGIPVPAGWTGRPVPGVLSSRPAGAALRPAA